MSPRATALITGGRPLPGAPELPADLAVLERALLLCALCEGETLIATKPPHARARNMCELLRAFGVAIAEEPHGLRVLGAGLGGLRAPSSALDAGTSELGLASAVALLAGQRFGTRVAHAGAPGCVPRLVQALRARGAQVRAAQSCVLVAPLLEHEALGALEHVLDAPDPHAKTAILLSGLFSHAPTAVGEPLLSMDHTERMLTALGVPLRRMGSMSGFDPAEWSRHLPAFGELALPGDTGVASGVAAIASCLPQSRVVLDAVGFNPTRTGLFDALRLAGGRLVATERGDTRGREPLARIVVESASLRGGPIGGELPLRAGPAALSLPLLGLGAARPCTLHLESFTSTPDGLWPELARLLRAFGIDAELTRHTLTLSAGSRARPARVDVQGDGQLAWLALSLATVANGQSELAGMPVLDEHWPSLLGVLSQLGVSASVESEETPSEPKRAKEPAVSHARRIVVAIDGPAGAGKSTVARELARRLGYTLVDTGALYRGVALLARERGISWDDAPALGALTEGLALELRTAPDGSAELWIDGRCRAQDIRTPEISMGASDVSRHPEVRAALLGLQRQLGRNGGVVLEGRDIGTVVFPNAEAKLFLTASPEARAQRRVSDLAARGLGADYETTLAEVKARDAQDENRPVAPLKPAEGSVIVDSTNLDIEHVVDRLLELARDAGAL